MEEQQKTVKAFYDKKRKFKLKYEKEQMNFQKGTKGQPDTWNELGDLGILLTLELISRDINEVNEKNRYNHSKCRKRFIFKYKLKPKRRHNEKGIIKIKTNLDNASFSQMILNGFSGKLKIKLK